MIALLLTMALPGYRSRFFLLRAVALLVLGLLIVESPWRNHLANSILFGTAFMFDGAIRAAASIVLRFSRWRLMLGGACLELVLALFAFSSIAATYERTVPLCVGIAMCLTTAMLFGLTYSLSTSLIALDLAERGFGDAMIGLNAAMQAIGVLVVAPLLPRLVGRFGVHSMMLAALVATAPVLASFPFMPSLALWFPLRILLGGASQILFVLAQAWVTGLSTEKNRGRALAVYITFVSLGLALGPLILALIGSLDATPYLVGAALVLLGVLLLLTPHLVVPPFERPPAGGLLRFFRIAPIAILTTMLNAGLEAAGLCFLPLYAMSAGWTEERATLLISTLMFGAILMQIPIGWLGDKVDRRRLAVALSFLSSAGALAWPFVLHLPWIAFPLLFVWGGLFVGIYTTVLTIVGGRFKGGELVGIYTVMRLTWGVGALLGPALAGIAMNLFTHGLPLFAAAACLVFALFLAATRREI